MTQTVFYAVELRQDEYSDSGCDGIDLSVLQHMQIIIQKRKERECVYVYLLYTFLPLQQTVTSCRQTSLLSDAVKPQNIHSADQEVMVVTSNE